MLAWPLVVVGLVPYGESVPFVWRRCGTVVVRMVLEQASSQLVEVQVHT